MGARSEMARWTILNSGFNLGENRPSFLQKNGTLGTEFGTALQRHYIATRPRQDK